MRKTFLFLLAFLLLAVPAQAQETVDVEITISTILVFTVNNATPLTYTYDAYGLFGSAQDIGDVDYDLTCNQGWQVDGIILDGTQNGQTADDWDDTNWTLSVNAVTIDESASATVDSDGNAVYRTGSVWQVLLTIPWPESNQTPDCTIQLTASAV
jgi:hypothetical protein